MKIYEAQPDDQLFSRLIDFSEDWERENSTHGYRKNNRGDIENNRIFLAEENEEIIGYLFKCIQIRTGELHYPGRNPLF